MPPLLLGMAVGTSWESRLSLKSPSLARFLVVNAKAHPQWPSPLVHNAQVWQQWPSPLRNQLRSAPFVSRNGGWDQLGEHAQLEISIIGDVPG